MEEIMMPPTYPTDIDQQQKEFQCPICMKYFSRKFTLEMHLLIHQGVKPHPCPFCGKCFRQKGTLMRHKALHSSKNLFHCRLCNRGFRQKNVFLHHLKHRHNVFTESLDRRKWRTQAADYQSVMNNLPSFVVADTTAITSSDKHLEAMLFQSYGSSRTSVDRCNLPTLYKMPEVIGVESLDSNESNKSHLDCNLLPQDVVHEAAVPNSLTATFNNTPCKREACDVEQSLGENGEGSPFRYECYMCSELFMSYDDYTHHIKLMHNNDDSLIDRKPIMQPFVHNFPESQKNENVSIEIKRKKTPQNLVKKGQFSPKRIVSGSDQFHTFNTPSASSTTSGTSLTSELTFSCIPCQQDFSKEEDLEYHVKSHVQSVLLSDSESTENDNSCRRLEYVNTNTVPTEMKNYISNYSQMAQEGSIIKAKLKPKLAVRNHIPTCSLPPKRTMFSVDTNVKQMAKSNILGKSFKDNCLQPNVIKPLLKIRGSSDKLANFKGIRSSQRNPFLKSSLKYLRKRNIVAKTSNFAHTYSDCSVIKSKDKFKLQKSNRYLIPLFFCPFCKKYFSNARTLCQHTTLHLSSIIPKTKTTSKNLYKAKKNRKIYENNRISIMQSKNKMLPAKSKSIAPMQKNIQLRIKNNVKFHRLNNILSKEKLSQRLIHKRSHLNISYRATTDVLNSTTVVHSKAKQCFNKSVKHVHKNTNFHNPRVKQFICKKCGKILKNKISLDYHLQMHLTVHVFKCFTCKKSFLYKSLLLRHMRLNHMKNYTCDKCSRTFQYISIFKFHVQKCSVVSVSRNSVYLPLVDIQQLLNSNTDGIVGIVPVNNHLGNTSDGVENVQRSQIGIPVVSLSHLRLLSNLPILGSISLQGVTNLIN